MTTLQILEQMFPVTEALLPAGVAKVEAMITQYGARPTAIKLVDFRLSRRVGVSSEDLADTVTFANGVDEIEAKLRAGNIQGAWTTADKIAKKMIREEGGNF